MGDIITVPFSWLLMTLYDLVNNYGLAIILFALIVKLITLPFQMKSKKSTMRMSIFTPRLKELEKKYGDNKVKYQEEVAKLYKEENIKPLGGCLWSLIPFPILIALYSVIRQPFTKMMRLTTDQWTYLKDKIFPSLGIVSETNVAYEQISLAQQVHDRFGEVQATITEHANTIAETVGNFTIKDIDFSFLGLNLAKTPDFKFFLNIEDWSFAAVWPALGLFLIPFISAGLSFLASKISQKATAAPDQGGTAAAPEQGGMKGMMVMMPLISLWIGFVMPAGLGIYWIANSVFGILQDLWLTKKYGKLLAAEQAIRDEKSIRLEQEREKKRLEAEQLGLENKKSVNPNTSKRKIQNLEKQIDEKKTAEWMAAHGKAKKKDDKDNPSQVGERVHARGRNYKPDRFQKGYIADTQEDSYAEGDISGSEVTEITDTIDENNGD